MEMIFIVNTASLIDYYLEINKLKTTYRYGKSDLSFKDSAADHSWKVALIAIDLYHFLNLKLDLIKAVKMGLIHDLGEYNLNTDTESWDVRSKPAQHKKHLTEKSIIEKLTDEYDRPDIYELWLEFEAQETKEAKYVKALDKIEIVLHIIDRTKKDVPLRHLKFIATYCHNSINNFPELKPFYLEVQQKLKSCFKEKGNYWNPKWNIE